jgi:hypothetical protein
VFSAPTSDIKNSQAESGAQASAERTFLLAPREGRRRSYSGNQYLLGRLGKPGSGGALLQRKCDCGGSGGTCEKCEKDKLLRRSPASGRVSSAPAVPSIVHDVLNSSGRPLDAGTRSFMEPRFNHDFGNVQIHTDSKAAESAKAVHAHAYTVGNHVVFGVGKYSPQSGEGRRLLAHELAHTVQQGGMNPSFAGKLEIGEAGDAYERQADMAAEGIAQEPGRGFAGLSSVGTSLQRDRNTPSGGSTGASTASGVCGPNVGSALAAVLADVGATFTGWTADQKRQNCSALTHTGDDATGGPVAEMAWDINQLFLPHTAWLRGYPAPCATPPAPASNVEDPSTCGNSVELDGQCFLAGTVNYALFGKICRLCKDEFPVRYFYLDPAGIVQLVTAWKIYDHLINKTPWDAPGPASEMALIGYSGYPGHSPSRGNRPQCATGVCHPPPAVPTFTWTWVPNHGSTSH